MRRRRHTEEHENHERWLVSYADFITLLFAFFVVMYSISSINEGKYKVADPVAFGAWLKKNGLDDYYEPMPVATADACDAGWLRNLIEKDFEGELPDGVTYSAPAAPQVKFSLDVEQARRLFDSDPSAMMALLEAPSDDAETEEPDRKPADPLAELGL